MDKLNYSIIIPHKDIPHLLQRCLDSIPRRDDLQIIIVDDNSNPNIVDFNNFPGIDDPIVNIIYDKNGKGVGAARNIGLDYMLNMNLDSKWLIFADADDFFNPCFEETLEKFKNDENDLIFFRTNSAISDTLEPSFNNNYVDDKVNLVQTNKDFDLLRYNVGPVWGRFIKYSIIKKNKLRFPEIRSNEDTLFSAKLGKLSNKIDICNQIIYCYTSRQNSLVTNQERDYIVTRYFASKEVTEYLQKETTTGYLYTQYNVIWFWTILATNYPWKGIIELPELWRLCNKKDILNSMPTIIKRIIKKTFYR